MPELNAPAAGPLLWYADTSAVAKLLRTEAESLALAQVLDGTPPPQGQPIELVSCPLLITELRRFALRAAIAPERVNSVLERIGITEAPLSLFVTAGLLPGPALRSLDAIHLAGCIESGADALLSYDERLTEVATAIGVPVVAPGLAESNKGILS